MLPLMPYAGALRPLLMGAAIIAMIWAVDKTSGRPCHKRALIAAAAGYALFMLYATFLSRTVGETYEYRLKLMGTAGRAFSLESGLHIAGPELLEGVVLNIMLFVPVGYLAPQLFRLPPPGTIAAGAGLSAAIEIGQLLTKLGMLDVDDFVFNTLGTALGMAVLLLLSRQRRNKTIAKGRESR